jgi:hypothetical protein
MFVFGGWSAVFGSRQIKLALKETTHNRHLHPMTAKSGSQCERVPPMAKPSTIPQSFDDAVATLLDRIGPAKRKWLQSISGPDLSERTWYLACWIRNEFGLWGGKSPLLHQTINVTGDEDKDLAAGFDNPHPDDLSAAIIRAAWEKLRMEQAEGSNLPESGGR